MRAWVRTLGRWLHRAVLLHCWALLCLYLMFKLYERSHFIDVLPAAIEPIGVVLISGESGFREGCGVAVLRMAPELRARLRREGLAALQDAQQARGYPDENYYRYQPWQPTPAPGTGEDGVLAPIFLGLQCADADDELTSRIGKASQEAGGYYSEKGEAALLLLPREGLIVFGYFG
jgi:hypothetical protein